jgi:hypothetical protein
MNDQIDLLHIPLRVAQRIWHTMSMDRLCNQEYFCACFHNDGKRLDDQEDLLARQAFNVRERKRCNHQEDFLITLGYKPNEFFVSNSLARNL